MHYKIVFVLLFKVRYLFSSGLWIGSSKVGSKLFNIFNYCRFV